MMQLKDCDTNVIINAMLPAKLTVWLGFVHTFIYKVWLKNGQPVLTLNLQLMIFLGVDMDINRSAMHLPFPRNILTIIFRWNVNGK